MSSEWHLRRKLHAAGAAGRRLHVGSEGAAPSVAAIMSLVERCKRMGINPRSYLEDVLPQRAAAHPDKVAEGAGEALLAPRAGWGRRDGWRNHAGLTG